MIDFQNISYKYPFTKNHAVKNITFNIKEKEVFLITGESGCGKSTIAKIANGLIPHYLKGNLEGKVFCNQKNNTEYCLAEISNDVGTLFQDPEQQFFCTDVYSELAFAHEINQKDIKEIQKTVNDISDKFSINDIINSSIFTLSEGEKQKVALASVMSLKPKCLILDEPTANLSPESTKMLANYITILKNNGFAILIVDHRLYWLKNIVDQVLIMKNGQIKEKIKFEQLNNNNIKEKYGLREHNLIIDNKNNSHSSNLNLEVKKLDFKYNNNKYIFKNFNMKFPIGFVTAVSGPNGCGKTTLSRLITGLIKPQSGEFILEGKKYKPKNLLKISGLVLQNMDHQLYAETALKEVNNNINLLEKFQLKEFAERHPHSLSGGQKQRLVIAAALSKNPKIIILDEPTSGLDGANMRIIGETLKEEAKKNKLIIVITHDLEFINLYCDNKIMLNN